MHIQFLGTGTSVGIPVIGCDCAVCRSPDPRNRRLRASLWVQSGRTSLIIDTAPDFREQALRHGVHWVDAVFFTHAHADHIFGFDDIRRFNTLQDSVIPAYGLPGTIETLRNVFSYIGHEKVPGLFRPQITFHALAEPVTVGAIRVTPLPVDHGGPPTCGYLCEADGARVAYVPDCKHMPAETLARIRGVDLLALDALKPVAHRTHLSLPEALELVTAIAPRRALLTHMCHDLDHADTERGLPAHVRLAYDGLALDVPDGNTAE